MPCVVSSCCGRVGMVARHVCAKGWELVCPRLLQVRAAEGHDHKVLRLPWRITFSRDGERPGGLPSRGVRTREAGAAPHGEDE